MSEQPEALRLAYWLQNAVQTYPQMSEDEPGGYYTQIDQVMDESAAELLRLHALCEEMGEALEGLERFVREADEECLSFFNWVAINAEEGKAARAAIAKWKESK